MANKNLILLVEDDERIAAYTTAILQANGYEVQRAADGQQALAAASSYCPDLILLDLGLPDTDGVEVLRTVRAWMQTPIVVVTARANERDMVQALDMGADDYVIKPFKTSELLARIRNALRHRQATAAAAAGGVFRTGGLQVDTERRSVTLDGREVRLTQTEYNILSLLIRHAGRVLTYEFVMKETWGPAADTQDNQILRVNMANIRRKIEQNPAQPQYIFTEMGVGYRMASAE